MILMDGPLKDTRVKHAEVMGRLLVIPEYQHCGQKGCIAHHWITHEYTRAGWWIRSSSALRDSDLEQSHEYSAAVQVMEDLRAQLPHVEQSTECAIREAIELIQLLSGETT